jgi:hypothetical protein
MQELYLEAILYGRKYNGKALVCLMDYSCSNKIMDEISTHLFSIPELYRIQKEIDQWMTKFKKILSVFDGVFPIVELPLLLLGVTQQLFFHVSLGSYHSISVNEVQE